jgi:hypothetical protein
VVGTTAARQAVTIAVATAQGRARCGIKRHCINFWGSTPLTVE